MRSARWIVILALLAVAGAVEVGQAVEVLGRSVYPYPAWDAATTATDVEKYATEAEYRAACDSSYVLEKIRYRSDGLAVVACYYHPRNRPATLLPVIVFNRGSYVRSDIAPELLPMFHRLANAGFVIVAPMYRGSDGGEGHDEMGGADLDDLMNVVPLLGQLEAVDTRNTFLFGESRGGMMVFQAIRDGFPARAAATVGAFTDLGEMTASPPGEAMARSIWPDFDARRDDIIARRSALRWPEKLGIPLLLMHGGRDREVAPLQTLRLATELAKAGKEFGLVMVADGNHTLRQYQAERDRQVIDFFRRRLVE